MAGYPPVIDQSQSKIVSLKSQFTEVNTSGTNQLMYVFRDMLFQKQQNNFNDSSSRHLGSSKFFQEISRLVISGQNKFSFLQMTVSSFE